MSAREEALAQLVVELLAFVEVERNYSPRAWARTVTSFRETARGLGVEPRETVEEFFERQRAPIVGAVTKVTTFVGK